VAIRKTEEEKQAERQAMERARLAREAEQAQASGLAGQREHRRWPLREQHLAARRRGSARV
jgi:hypothetical protein